MISASLFCLAVSGLLTPEKPITPQIDGGLQMGYSLGQNGQGWPQPLKKPLNNLNRGGFYISQARLNLTLPLDSSFKAVGKFNAIYLDMQELYLEKAWQEWTFTLGKFRGAGLHSGVGQDEFEAATVRQPYYSRYWSGDKRLFNFRDVGIQAERRHFGGQFTHRLFIHNSTGQSYIGEEPSYVQSAPLQALGFDYAWDLHLPDSNTIGGHLGALADREWDEFLGSHDFWEAGYWFKTNPIVDGSFYHDLQGKTWTWKNEMLVRYNRRWRNPWDEKASQAWAVMTQFQKSHTPRFQSVWRYEFFDPTDGLSYKDNLHLVTAGLRFKPSPTRQPGFSVLGEYVLVREEGFKNTVGNDMLYLQTQVVF
jgi:hypothetical protein